MEVKLRHEVMDGYCLSESIMLCSGQALAWSRGAALQAVQKLLAAAPRPAACHAWVLPVHEQIRLPGQAAYVKPQVVVECWVGQQQAWSQDLASVECDLETRYLRCQQAELPFTLSVPDKGTVRVPPRWLHACTPKHSLIIQVPVTLRQMAPLSQASVWTAGSL